MFGIEGLLLLLLDFQRSHLLPLLLLLMLLLRNQKRRGQLGGVERSGRRGRCLCRFLPPLLAFLFVSVSFASWHTESGNKSTDQ